MNATLLYLLETTLCSGVLLAVYSILLERRIPFGWSRCYLLTSTLVAALVPLLRIPVWAGEVIEIHAATLPQESLPPLVDTAQSTATLSAAVICGVLYALGVLVIAADMVRQAIRIMQLRRGAEIRKMPRFQIVLTQQPIASFSFLGSIYIQAATAKEELPAILAHEASHIAHRHSVERIVMACMKAALWWNPFVWITSRRLTEVEEFEADSDVLADGYDRETYMNILFRQLFGYNPEIANSLRDSLTKKRFKMMTTKLSGRYALLRMAATLPAVIGLLFAFSFTTRAAEIQVIGTPPTDLAPQVEQAEPEKIPAQTQTAPNQAQATAAPQKVLKATVTVYLWDKGDRSFSSDNIAQGAIVKVANGNKGTTTNAQGKAELDVPVGTVLEVLYPDYEAMTLTINAGQTGYTAMLRHKSAEPLSSAFYTRDSDGMKHTPLIVIDGISKSNMDQVDASNIESISVLKDKSATALYGERGKYGVIVITSKTAAKAAHKQAETGDSQTEEEIPFLITEEMPKFKGGNLNVYREWVQSQIKYPASALEKKLSGRVVLSFVVERNGEVSDIQILQSPDKSFSDEARRIIASTPVGAWTPGRQGGKTVRVKYTLPIDFRMTEPQPAQAAEPATK